MITPHRIPPPFRLFRFLIPYIENTTYRLKNRSGINLTPSRGTVSRNDRNKNTTKLNSSVISKKIDKCIVNKK